MTTLTPAAKAMTKARIKLITRQPFFGVLALRLQLIEDDTIKPPTLCTNGKVIRFHPDWVNAQTPDVIEAGIAHEIGHCALQHMGRRAGRTPKRWNHAVDYATNDMLEQCGFTIPPTWVHDKTFSGLSAEKIYSLLPEEEDGDGDGPFDGHEEQDLKPSDAKQLSEEWKMATVQAANVQAARDAAAGKSTADALKRFIDELTAPKVDWRAALRRFVTSPAKDDYAWQRPARKALSLGLVLPGAYSETVDDMTTVIDTSGSITNDILKAFGGEIADIRETAKPRMLRSMYCDHEVNHVDEFEGDQEFYVEPHGGRMTDFRPPFEWLKERGVLPSCLAYLTDGYGTFPDEPPPYPVLWVMTTDVQPPWGDVIRIEL